MTRLKAAIQARRLFGRWGRTKIIRIVGEDFKAIVIKDSDAPFPILMGTGHTWEEAVHQATVQSKLNWRNI